MPASKHFFEGYCRSKDVLQTISQKLVSATLTTPWEIKSSGLVPATVSVTAYRNKQHVCMSRELPDGNKVNLFFYESWKTTTNEIWGNPIMVPFYKNGCDVNNNVFVNKPDVAFNLYYHSSQIADTDANPQFAWYWMQIDENELIINIFGNQGAAGTATPAYGAIFAGMGTAKSNSFKDSFICYDITNNSGRIWDSSIMDYIKPDYAPATWSDSITSANCVNNISTINPDPITSKFIVTRPSFAQGTVGGSLEYSFIETHVLGRGQLLFCQSGTGSVATKLLRGDIVTIDSEACDYVHQNLNGTVFHQNILIKRMESVTGLTAVNNYGQIRLGWQNPKKCFGVKILRKLDSMPINQADGDVVFNQNTDNGLLIDTLQAVTDSTAVSGNYYYRAFAYDSQEIYSVPVNSASANVTI